MKKVIIIVIIGIALAIGGFFLYLQINKAESEVIKSESVSSNFPKLEGHYISTISDPVTSELMFDIGGATATTGKFNEFTIDANFAGENSSIEVSIKSESIYTAESMRDDHLRGADFFNVMEFPEIKFISNSVSIDASNLIAVGKIYFMGVEKDLEIPFKHVGQHAENPSIEIFEGTFDFNRVNYGMSSEDIEEVVQVSFYSELTKQ